MSTLSYGELPHGYNGYGGTMVEITITLEKKESLTVNAVDGSGSAISDASVNISGPQSASGTTDTNGQVIFDPIPAGDYTVTVTKTGYFDGTQTVTVG